MAPQWGEPSWHSLSERLRRSKNPRKAERRERRQAIVAVAEGRKNTIRLSDWGERDGRERKHKSVQGQGTTNGPSRHETQSLDSQDDSGSPWSELAHKKQGKPQQATEKCSCEVLSRLLKPMYNDMG